MKFLIVVDMQNDFITGALANPAAEAIVPKIAEYVRKWDGHLILTKDTHHSDYLKTMEGRNLPVEHCIQATEGWQVCDEISNASFDGKFDGRIEAVEYLSKPTFGYVKGLRKIIDSNPYPPTSIELCGTCTDICVVSNVLGLKEAYPECEIIVHKDMCAGVTPESHEAALKVMEMCQVKIV